MQEKQSRVKEEGRTRQALLNQKLILHSSFAEYLTQNN